MQVKSVVISMGCLLAIVPLWSFALQLPNRNQDAPIDDPFQPGQRGGPVLTPPEPQRRAPPPPPPPPPPAESALPAPSPAQTAQPIAAVTRKPAPAINRTPFANNDSLGFSVSLTSDLFARIAGGNPDVSDGGAAPSVADVVWSGETRPVGLWENGQYKFHLIYTFGSSPAEMTGSVQPVSHIDDPNHAFNFLEAWYEHFFPYNNTWWRAGIMDFNNDFYRTPYVNDLFLNRTFHVGAEIGRLYSNGQANISLFPLTSLGVRGKTFFSPNVYLMGAIFDGSTGPKTVEYGLSTKDGVMLNLETGWLGDDRNGLEGSKFTLGAWYLQRTLIDWVGHRNDPDSFTDKYMTAPDFAGAPKRGLAGYYALASLALGDLTHIFLRAGRSNPNVNRFGVTYSGGVVVKGLVPGRQRDLLGFGVSYTNQAAYSARYTDLMFAKDLTVQYGLFDSEVAFETTYSVKFGDWLVLQPNYQYIVRSGMHPLFGNVALAGLRLRLKY